MDEVVGGEVGLFGEEVVGEVGGGVELVEVGEVEEREDELHRGAEVQEGVGDVVFPDVGADAEEE